MGFQMFIWREGECVFGEWGAGGLFGASEAGSSVRSFVALRSLDFRRGGLRLA